MNEWELTDEEIEQKILGLFRSLYGKQYEYVVNESLIAIARYFLTQGRQETLAHLASQCGDDPCVGCEDKRLCKGQRRVKGLTCMDYRFWEGQLAQAAKDEVEMEARIQKREQEIVEWLNAHQCVRYMCGRWELAAASLSEWLQEKGEGRG